MRRWTGLGFGSTFRVRGLPSWALASAAAAAVAAAAAAGCGGDDTGVAPATSTSTTTTTTGGAGGTGGVGQGGAPQGGGGAGPYSCTLTAPSATRGSAIAVSPDDATLLAVNRDVGSVTVLSVAYPGGLPALTTVGEVDTGTSTSEPWQVALDACGGRAYVLLRQEQKVVAIDNIATIPVEGAEVLVGSEPTGIAISPNNTQLFVANWVEGTVSVVDTSDMTVTETIDLNQALIATNLLGGSVTATRPALAHPRAVAVTNNGDADDSDETVYVTEWFAQRTAPETAATADTNKKGLVYKFSASGTTVTTIDLPPVTNTNFNDHLNAATGCFPNQVGSITIEGSYAYVTSTCASPRGPLGVFQRGACTTNANCTSINVASVCTAGRCTLACTVDSDCGFGSPPGTCNVGAGGTCAPINTDVKTTTHPAVSIINLANDTATTQNIDDDFDASAVDSARMPLLPTDVGFRPGFGYVASMGADALFRLVVDATTGNITSVGAASADFINLRKPAACNANAPDTVIKLPIGVAVANTQGFAFVANEGSREVTAVDLNAQAIAVGAGGNDCRIAQSSALPTPASAEDQFLRGKRFFVTGLGRWSFAGEAWGSCAACHIDGLSDNVTWYFARGPRQSTSLDGSFDSADATDQRILNWTAVFDEVADFELNTRGVSGGVGAIVSAANSPPTNADRINIAGETPPQQGLQGSTEDVADPGGTSSHPHSVLADWNELKVYIQGIRSPRRPVGLVAADVTAGETIFTTTGQGNCIACHSGPKWTISTVFYTPGDLPNAATADAAATSLGNQNWQPSATTANFPAALFPVDNANLANARMRFGAPPGAEQLQCILRPVGTFGISPAEVGVVEVRADMTTAAQGSAGTGRGYNPPSLLGMQAGAPYFHAGNARTLEEVLSATFLAHHQSAVAQVFSPTATEIRQLTAYVLSIDEDEASVTIPTKGPLGGDLCFYTP